ncbi:unnamed protein product [Caenorhabditis auriculariae]|uniref:non-specific serine/threonine protein kinase n=1 Tax=Caenorhabditis auriculariae TaxID=2777116 RepID=A0A8S1GX04_9PELO|nr:unnamed protein product [Caenorhabditis auriculariae]
MPPKKGNNRLHELCTQVKSGTSIVDVKKRTFVVGNQFAVGGFGRIHTCKEAGTSKELVIKLEPAGNGPLFTEVNVFQRILRAELIENFKAKNKIRWLGVPHVIANGIFDYGTERMRYLIIPKYAVSLESIRESAKGGKFSSEVCLQIAQCIIDALEYIHDLDYTHADIKAANILLERANDFSSAVLVDYGLARKSNTNEDKPDKKRAHNGTAIFTSRDAHRGCQPSYRGDLEILAYNLIFWASGKLPWLALEATPQKVFEAKQKFFADLPDSLSSLTKGASCEELVKVLLEVSNKTSYTAKVDYKLIKKTFVRTSSKLATPKRSSRAVKSRRKAELPIEKTVAKKKAAVKRKSEEDVENVQTTPPKSRREVVPGLSNFPARKTPQRKVAVAKKVEKKYKRLSMGRVVLKPSSSLQVFEEQISPGGNTKKSEKPQTSSTPSADSPATKARIATLKKAPGVQNFPRGRRSIAVRQVALRNAAVRKAEPEFAA